MNHRVIVLLGLAMVGLSGCATPYQRLTAFTATGGYTDQDLGKDVVRVEFGANGYTSRETAQAFWLWRCMEVTMEKGFDGFEILSDMRLSNVPRLQPGPVTSEPTMRAVAYTYVPIIVPIDDSRKPFYTGDIHLLKGPIAVAPPKVFDARMLKEQLGPYVLPAIKDRANVKAHIHEYLLPPGKLTDPN
jgi:hypothetical protein